MPEVEQADPHLTLDASRVAAIGENVLDVVPGRGLNLKHAPGAGAGDHPRLVPRLHPRERTRQPTVNAVIARPVVDLPTHSRLNAQTGEPAVRATEDGERLRPDDAVGLQASAFLRSDDGRLGDGSEAAVDRDEDAASAEEKLQLGDVPAAAAPPEQAIAQLVPGPDSEPPPGSRAGDPVRRQVVAALEVPRRAFRLRARDSVERSFVIAALEERELQRGRPG